MLRIKVFGRENCPLCKKTLDKFRSIIEKWGISGSVSLEYYDMDTVEGLAEGSFCEVTKIPTTIIFNHKELKRWEGVVPDISEFASVFFSVANPEERIITQS